ncbi:Ion channel protein [Streptomyces sp. CC53]|uniref:potassium channel family protein n=1 Tax=unclassified Streptomyces TaxID=2593676 RepID=UPI0008DDED7D|nr:MULTISPECIES: potassium channel family protein [unclassified Streptomyces]OII62969.1 Ion channel protein [Streptomyces sp. CC53]
MKQPEPRSAGQRLLTGQLKLPRQIVQHPLRQVAKRLTLAAVVLLFTGLIVALDRDGYKDGADGQVSVLDAFYYATVTLSTTGYGDIVPVSDAARLINVFVVTPLRVIFLIILVGTTLEVLAERTRQEWREKRWRRALRDHTVVVGFGTKGRSALETLSATGLKKDQVVVVDPNSAVIDLANADGFTGVLGDATRSDVLLRAQVQRAGQIIVATQRDDTAVLVTLTARQLNRRAKIVAAVREEENAALLRQSGADAVITSASAAGRLLGMSVLSPSTGTVIEGLIQRGTGLDIVERPVTKAEAGRGVRETGDLVVSVLRGHRLIGYDDPEASPLQLTDRVITIVRAVNGSNASAPSE